VSAFDSPLVIVGAGDHGRVVLELLRSAGEAPIGFAEPRLDGADTRVVEGLPVIGDLHVQTAWIVQRTRFVVALGDNQARRDAFQRCLGLGLVPAVAVHPSATLLTGARVEAGAMVCAGAVIGVAAWIGPNAIVNTAASVDHDGMVGAHAQVGPGAHLAGRVTVEEGGFIGIGAAVREGRTIGAWALVAGGAMVIDDVAAGERVGGVPARPMTPPRA
jgi:sugar O-acyltransferase (sialic acid O-acetyltransferase NeuD family)